MQVERFLEKNLPLISSSLTLTLDITAITIRKFPKRSISIYRYRYRYRYRQKAQLKDILRVFEVEAVALAFRITVTVMASNVETDDNLAAPNHQPGSSPTAASSASAEITLPDRTSSDVISDNNRPYKNHKKSHDPDPATVDHKRKRFAKGNSNKNENIRIIRNENQQQ